MTSAPSDAAMRRAEKLLRQMTVEEEAMQLSSAFPLALRKLVSAVAVLPYTQWRKRRRAARPPPGVGRPVRIEA